MDEKTILQWTVFGWMKNHSTVDSLWMDEKPLQSGQSSDGRKTFWTVNVNTVLMRRIVKQHCFVTVCYLFWGVKRHVQDTQHKTSARTPIYYITLNHVLPQT